MERSFCPLPISDGVIVWLRQRDKQPTSVSSSVEWASKQLPHEEPVGLEMAVGALAICFSPTPALGLPPQGEKFLIIYPALAKEKGGWEDKEAAGAGSEGGGRRGESAHPPPPPDGWLRHREPPVTLRDLTLGPEGGRRRVRRRGGPAPCSLLPGPPAPPHPHPSFLRAPRGI